MFLFHVQGEAVNALYGALKAKSLNSCPGEITAGMPATADSGRHSGGFFFLQRGHDSQSLTPESATL